MSDILLGMITGAHGLNGEVRVRTCTRSPERLSAYGPLHTAGGGRVLEVAAARGGKAGFAIVRFRGIDDRIAAEALVGAELYVERNALPDIGEDEFYHTDLVGLRAQDSAGNVMGEVRAIHNHGASDVIEIVRVQGGTLLLPLAADFVTSIDIAGGTVTIVEPADGEAEERRGIE